MTLDILVPQFQETEEIIKPLLDSINFQQAINHNDVGVIIVNDGSNVILSQDFLNSYKFKVTYIMNKHCDVSATRQKALESSKADYVMFCDADDMFFNMCGLWIIFKEMQSEFDVLNSSFLEETFIPIKNSDEKMRVFITREQDATFVHGKVHRRQFLVDNDIKWNSNLTVHEDSFFNTLCLNSTDKIKYCPTAFYLWKWRDDSVCRRDFKYILKTYNNLLDSNTALVNEMLKRNKVEAATFYIANMVYDAYFTMNKDEWINQDNKEYRDATEKRFALYYKEFKQYFIDLPKDTQAQILSRLRTRFYQEGMLMETILFSAWIKIIEKLV